MRQMLILIDVTYTFNNENQYLLRYREKGLK